MQDIEAITNRPDRSHISLLYEDPEQMKRIAGFMCLKVDKQP